MGRKTQIKGKSKLISIPKAKIQKMNLNQVLNLMKKAEYEKVFTDKTWTNLDNRLVELYAEQSGKHSKIV